MPPFSIAGDRGAACQLLRSLWPSHGLPLMWGSQFIHAVSCQKLAWHWPGWRWYCTALKCCSVKITLTLTHHVSRIELASVCVQSSQRHGQRKGQNGAQIRPKRAFLNWLFRLNLSVGWTPACRFGFVEFATVEAMQAVRHLSSVCHSDPTNLVAFCFCCLRALLFLRAAAYPHACMPLLTTMLVCCCRH